VVPQTAFNQNVSPKKVFGQYRQFVWNEQQGLLQNTIESIVQTRDGYLWLGTAEGAVRFDGVNFTTFDAKPLRQDWPPVKSLVEDRSGALWFGIRARGLTRLKDGSSLLTRLRSGQPHI
jgi:ligand-binding sensor domain-containing protein